MLFKRADLDRIAAGSVTLAFRRWDRPHAKAGSRTRTAIGVIAIDSVEPVAETDLDDESARLAGYASTAELLRDLARYGSGQLFRMEVRVAGADPRIALRESTDLAPDEVTALTRRLDAMDVRSPYGPWTWQTLRLIAERPAVRAGDLELAHVRDVEQARRIPRGKMFLDD